MNLTTPNSLTSHPTLHHRGFQGRGHTKTTRPEVDRWSIEVLLVHHVARSVGQHRRAAARSEQRAQRHHGTATARQAIVAEGAQAQPRRERLSPRKGERAPAAAAAVEEGVDGEVSVTADRRSADGRSDDGRSADGRSGKGRSADGRSADGRSADDGLDRDDTAWPSQVSLCQEARGRGQVRADAALVDDASRALALRALAHAAPRATRAARAGLDQEGERRALEARARDRRARRDALRARRGAARAR